MERPTGVTIIAVLYWVGTFFFVCMSLLSLLGAGILAELLRKNGLEMLAGIGVALAVVLFFFSLLSALLGWGMWSLMNWARVVTIILCGLRFLSAATFLLWGLAHFNPFVVFSLLGLAINGIILWYLFQPHVKQAFRATSF